MDSYELNVMLKDGDEVKFVYISSDDFNNLVDKDESTVYFVHPDDENTLEDNQNEIQ